MSWRARAQGMLAGWRESSQDTVHQMAVLLQVCCLYHVSQDYGVSFSVVQGPSMLPTFHEAGDILAIERFYNFRKRLGVGDVVILKSPQDKNNAVCKRILAMEKELVQIDWSHPLYKGQTTIKVPKGHVWIEGDNKVNSTDSRTYGPVPLALVCGRVFMRVWPPDSMGFVESRLPKRHIL